MRLRFILLFERWMFETEGLPKCRYLWVPLCEGAQRERELAFRIPIGIVHQFCYIQKLVYRLAITKWSLLVRSLQNL